MPLSTIKDFFFPRSCILCNQKLEQSEQAICSSCLVELNYTNIGNSPSNDFEKIFWANVPVCRATSLLYYERNDLSAEILFHMKYAGRKDICLQMGKIFADRLKPTGFFQDIDLIIPVPLHPNRLRRRGYNQVELLAEGVSRQTGIPVCTSAIIRTQDNATQTKKSFAIRHANPSENQPNLFSPTPESDEILRGNHVLVMDDVLTSGTTLISCAQTVMNVPDITLSFATLAWSI